LCGVLEEILEIVVADARLLLERGPVTIAGFIKRDYEVVDGLRFRADLAKGDSGTGEGSSVAILAIAQWFEHLGHVKKSLVQLDSQNVLSDWDTVKRSTR
jgi:hypothetical protein